MRCAQSCEFASASLMFPSPRLFFHDVKIVLPLLALVLGTGCFSEKHIIEVNPHFSYNLIKTPLWFPDKKQKIGAAQQEILDSHGHPDFMRIYWRPDGTLITSRDLAGL